MTISVGTPVVQYTGNGSQTAFSITFAYTATSDLAVYIDGTLKTLTTHYTVASSTLTFLSAPVNGAIVEIGLAVPISRSTDFATGGDFQASAINLQLDRLTLIGQQVQKNLNRAIRIAPGFVLGDLDLNLTPAQRANTTIGFDGSGNVTTYAGVLVLPSTLTGQSTNMLRVKSDETGYELRTPAQVRSDTGADNASNLTSGTIGSARISGSYTGITGVGTITAGTWQGSVIGSAYISGSYTNITGLGTITVGTWNGTTIGVAYGGTGTTTSTGSGSVVLSDGPTLVTPVLGAATATTPSGGDNSTRVATTAWVNSTLGSAGLGTVTNVATGTGLTGGPITTTGTISLASIATGKVLANVSGSSAAPTEQTPSAVIDTIGSTQGQVLYRGASAWSALSAGSDAYKALFSGGSGANPTFAGAPKIIGSWFDNGTPASAVDFTSIPAGVKHLMIGMMVRPGTNNVGIYVQTYGADAVIDTGASDYSYWDLGWNSSYSSGSAGNTSSSIILHYPTNAVSSNTNNAFHATANINDIQSARYTTIDWRATYLDQAGSLGISLVGSGTRNEADRITGIRIGVSSGTMSGRIWLLGWSD